MSRVAKVSSVVCAVAVVACVVAMILASGLAFAMPSIQTAFIAKYPQLRETKIDSCTTCHMPVRKDFLNDYALALKEARMEFEKIEELDSDNDGTKNIDEIKNERFPGSRANSPEYFIFHVNFSEKDPDVGKVHFNHEMHVVKESFLSKGRCKNCHDKDQFPKFFNDEESMREVAHQICWRCHEVSGSKLAPTDCAGCHTGIKDILEQLMKESLGEILGETK